MLGVWNGRKLHLRSRSRCWPGSGRSPWSCGWSWPGCRGRRHCWSRTGRRTRCGRRAPGRRCVAVAVGVGVGVPAGPPVFRRITTALLSPLGGLRERRVVLRRRQSLNGDASVAHLLSVCGASNQIPSWLPKGIDGRFFIKPHTCFLST